MLKAWISNNLFLENKNLNSKRCRVDWFEKTNNISIYNTILSNTKFLPVTASFTERLYCIQNDITELVFCETCKTKLAKFKGFKIGYSYCSNKCAQNSTEIKEKIVSVNLQKYNSEYFVQTDTFKTKAKKTWNKKYGVDNPSKSDIVKQKKVDTCKSNYNVDYPQQSTEIRTKFINSNLDRYGVDNPMKFDTIKTKSKNTRLHIEFKRFFENIRFSDYITPLFTVDEYKGIDNEYPFKCKRCDSTFYDVLRGGKIPRCYACYPNTNSSLAENEIAYFIKDELGINVNQNDRTILAGLELDITIPEQNVAIEYNGLYFHSEISGNKPKHYHLRKTELCESIGWTLIHIFEDDWIFRKEIVKSKIRHILGKTETKLYARKCDIKQIDNHTAKLFLNKYHIQGYVPTSVKLGLFHKDELVAVMTFSKRKIFKNTEWELTRYATNHFVVGGASKLLKYFEKNYKPLKIISYALRHWTQSNVNVYRKLGFNELAKSDIGFHYVKDGIRYHRLNFQKHKLKDKLKIFDETLTAWQNMQLNGYDRIWDCGNLKYCKNQ